MQHYSFEKQLAQIAHSINEGRISHAYLFSRGDIEQMKECALSVAGLLLEQKIGEGINPDLTIVSPETDSGRISVEQIRQFRSYLSLAPHSSTYKVAVIESAERMGEDAQSMFLKLLEEPKGQAVIILIAKQPDILLSTIRSRTQEIRFASQQVSLDVKRYEESETIRKFRDLRKVSLSERFQYAATLSEDNKESLFMCSEWLGYLRALMIGEVKKKSLHTKRLKRLVELVDDTMSCLSSTNVNAKLSLERIMLAL
ncbi:MAG: hypothetical protein KJI69_00790 [Patescibacteria group bacterium]|nr:hypothetical protein [Patescibacteria group bacterium]